MVTNTATITSASIPPKVEQPITTYFMLFCDVTVPSGEGSVVLLKSAVLTALRKKAKIKGLWKNMLYY